MKRLVNYQPKPSSAPPPRAKAAGAAEEAEVLVTATLPPHRSLLLHAITTGTKPGSAVDYCPQFDPAR